MTKRRRLLWQCPYCITRKYCGVKHVGRDDDPSDDSEYVCTREPGHSGNHVACAFRAVMGYFPSYHRIVLWR